MHARKKKRLFFGRHGCLFTGRRGRGSITQNVKSLLSLLFGLWHRKKEIKKIC